MNISCNEISSKLKKSETMGFQWVESDPTVCPAFVPSVYFGFNEAE